jgi:hypothetical protein
MNGMISLKCSVPDQPEMFLGSDQPTVQAKKPCTWALISLKFMNGMISLKCSGPDQPEMFLGPDQPDIFLAHPT